MVEKRDSSARQEKVKELLKIEAISDQQTIVDLLRKNYNIKTNQTVVSRDLRKLGIIKKMRNGLLCYELPSIDIQTELLKLALVDIVHNEVMIVIKTHPGLADFVGDCLDSYSDLEILGCLAGENVLFVLPKQIKNIAEISQSICQKFQFISSKRAHA